MRSVLRFTDVLTPGNVFFVSSVTGGSGATYGYTVDAPLSTLDAAIALCTANKGDIIFVLPGHAEAIAAAGGITCDVAGVRIIGLGVGSNRPTLTWSATDSTLLVSAANVTIENLITKVSIDEVVSMISVTAANCVLDKVDFVETTSAQAIQWLLTTAAADGITVKNCRHVQKTAAAANSKWIQLVGVDDCCIVDNFFHIAVTNNAASVVISGSTALVGGQIGRNVIMMIGGTTNVSAILLVDTSVCMVHDNRVACTATAATTVVDVGNAGYAAENYALNDPDKSGLLVPAADT
jgi:hypothetical protein